MTNNNHPITPPLVLIEDWIEIAKPLPQRPPNPNVLATLAARWGADQQLAKDAKWLDYNALSETHLKVIPVGESLKEAMRPKPPSLKEQSIALIDKIQGNKEMWDIRDLDVIRRALESLP